MRAFLFWVIIISIGGGVLSVMLIPSQDSIALMQLRQKHHKIAEKYYKSEYEKLRNCSDSALIPSGVKNMNNLL